MNIATLLGLHALRMAAAPTGGEAFVVDGAGYGAAVLMRSFLAKRTVVNLLRRLRTPVNARAEGARFAEVLAAVVVGCVT